MNKETSIRYKMPLFFLAGLLVAVLLGVILSSGDQEVFVEAKSTHVDDLFYLSTSTVPLRVTGAVEASDAVMVSAQTDGVITSLSVQEGQRVSQGDVLAVQSSPILMARLRLSEAEKKLISLQQTDAETQARYTNTQAETRAYSDVEVAALRMATNDNRVKEASDMLKNSLKQSLLVAIELSDYVNNKRSFFTAEGLSVYDQVVNNLYGKIPNYFKGGVTRSNPKPEALLDLIDGYESQNGPGLLHLESIASITEEQLEALRFLLTTAEGDIFDRKNSNLSDADKEVYLKYREIVLQTSSSLLENKINYQKVIDASIEDLISQEELVKVSATDVELSLLQEEFAGEIKNQSEIVSAAARDVVLAELSLTQPVAPFSGVISKVHVDLGEYVTAGKPIVTLVGVDAKELVVTVPTHFLSDVKVGLPFWVDDKMVGAVSKFSPVANGGAGTLFISLYNNLDLFVGSSINGEIRLYSRKEVYKVPRKYLHFDTTGPFVKYQSGDRGRAVVLYDTGEFLYVQLSVEHNEPVLPATSIAF